MCGRFALATPLEDIAAQFASEPLSDLTPFTPSWNITPTTMVPVMTQHGVHGESQVPRHFRMMQWGFRASWAKPSHREPINARLESVHEKPMFRSAFERRRGVVVADGWYEWMTTPRGKVPFYHRRVDKNPCLFAAIWDTWISEGNALESFAMLTRGSNADCAPVHDRMPVLLTNEHLGLWLTEGEQPDETPTSTIARHPVSTEVNRVTANHPGLIEPIPTLFDQEYG